MGIKKMLATKLPEKKKKQKQKEEGVPESAENEKASESTGVQKHEPASPSGTPCCMTLILP